MLNYIVLYRTTLNCTVLHSLIRTNPPLTNITPHTKTSSTELHSPPTSHANRALHYITYTTLHCTTFLHSHPTQCGLLYDTSPHICNALHIIPMYCNALLYTLGTLHYNSTHTQQTTSHLVLYHTLKRTFHSHWNQITNNSNTVYRRGSRW